MIEFLFVGLLQAAAGDPQVVTETPAAPVEAPQATATQEVPDSVQRRRDRSRITCRDRAVIGSRMSNRVCMSQAEEEQMERDTQAEAHRMQRSGAWNGVMQ